MPHCRAPRALKGRAAARAASAAVRGLPDSGLLLSLALAAVPGRLTGDPGAVSEYEKYTSFKLALPPCSTPPLPLPLSMSAPSRPLLLPPKLRAEEEPEEVLAEDASLPDRLPSRRAATRLPAHSRWSTAQLCAPSSHRQRLMIRAWCSGGM